MNIPRVKKYLLNQKNQLLIIQPDSFARKFPENRFYILFILPRYDQSELDFLWSWLSNCV